MNPYHHSLTSVKLWGGSIEDYQPLHDWMDDTKAHFADARHRALKHHSLGIFQGEEKFGKTITTSDGKKVPVRMILEQHVKEDCGGRIPTVQDWFENMSMKIWMNRGYKIDKK
jgi:hypothetical protein